MLYGTFQKYGAQLGYHFIVGSLFEEYAYPGALPYT
jgi:hypothetical protein